MLTEALEGRISSRSKYRCSTIRDVMGRFLTVEWAEEEEKKVCVASSVGLVKIYSFVYTLRQHVCYGS